jgi:hypothetical protein
MELSRRGRRLAAEGGLLIQQFGFSFYGLIPRNRHTQTYSSKVMHPTGTGHWQLGPLRWWGTLIQEIILIVAVRRYF